MSKRICVFGDSITKGSHDFEKGGWTERLKLFLMKNGSDSTVLNLGISGDTSFNVLSRIKNESKARNARVIIVSIGTNDSLLEAGRNWINIDKFIDNLKGIYQVSQRIKAKIFFTGIIDIDEKLSKPVAWNKNIFYYNKEIKKYDLAIKGFCQEKNIVFIPMQGLLKKEETPDGIHPNADGHEKIFQAVKKSLEENNII